MMMHPEMIASLPIWMAGFLLVSCSIFASIIIELVVRRLIPLDVRMSHTAAASAMFNVIGTTYAVLLAFVAMLAWEGFEKA